MQSDPTPLHELEEANRLLAVANDALAQEVVEHRARLAAVEAIGAEFAATLDVDILVARTLEEATRATHAEAAVLLLGDPSSPRLTLEDAHLPDQVGGQFAHPTLEPEPGGVVAQALALNTPMQAQAPSSSAWAADRIVCEAIGLRPTVALAIPLSSSNIAGGKPFAAILLLDGRPRSGFLDEQVRVVRHIASIAALAFERTRLVRTMILRMVAMAELRDPHETGTHVRRVAGFSVAILAAWARRIGLARTDFDRMRDRLYIAALLHDIGKVGVSDMILGKPGRLDPDERRAMERHTSIGAGLFGGLRTDFDDAAREVVLGHHERWDGTGYPAGASAGAAGETIPLFARIVAIADVFDALSSPRVYKEAWSEERVLEHMRGEAGRHFDPILVECLIEAMPVVRRVQRRFAETAALRA
jgi:HD-GYP domain-containing protein (c-di-GMP phosphodiesterase class II)